MTPSFRRDGVAARRQSSPRSRTPIRAQVRNLRRAWSLKRTAASSMHRTPDHE